MPSISALTLSVFAAVFAVAVHSRPAAAAEPWSVPADHQRPNLTADQEQAWLQALVAASPHRLALESAPPYRPHDAQPVAAAADGYHQKLGALAGAQPKKPGRIVFGYLPYWTKKTAIIPWQTMTTLAWFSVGLSTTGVSNASGWNTAESKALIAKAHSNGVQLVLCFTQFSTASISAMLATPASRTKAVNDIATAVLAGGGDGANIDFEGLAKADRDKMSAFIDELTTTLKAKLPGADITLATPCVDWTDAWNYQFLAEHSDGLFVMAYAIHWGGGAPGPQLPMAAKAPWTHKTLQWVVDDYVLYGKAKNKAKIIVGLPLYGYGWPAQTDKIGSKSAGAGKAITFSPAQDAAAKAGGFIWDSASESTYFVTKDANGGWVQTWCDNQKALQMRVDYLHTHDVMLGLWAMGYSDGDPAVMAYIAAWQKLKPATGGAGDTGPVDAGGGGDTGSADAGGGDGSTADAGTADAGSADAAKPDAVSADAVKADSGAADTAKVDTAPVDVPVQSADLPPPDSAGADVAGAELQDSDTVTAADATANRGTETTPASSEDTANRRGDDPDGGHLGGNGAGQPEDTAAVSASVASGGANSGCAAASSGRATPAWILGLGAAIAVAAARRRSWRRVAEAA